jgi:hypothetical protein
VGLSLGVNNPPQTKAIDLPRHQSLKAETRYNSDNTPFQLCKVYNGTGGALTANRPYLLTFAGTSTTAENPRVLALAAQAGVQNHIVIAHEAIPDASWGWVCYQGYHDCGIEGTTDVSAGDYLLVSAGVSTTGLVKDGTSRTQQSCAIACEAQATNSVVDKRVYLFGGPALTSIAESGSTQVLTAAAAGDVPLTINAHASQSAALLLIQESDGDDTLFIDSSGRIRHAATTQASLSALTGAYYVKGAAADQTTCRIVVENTLYYAEASASVQVHSATGSGGLVSYPVSFATAALQDYTGLFINSTATGCVVNMAATTQNFRLVANGGLIFSVTGASPAIHTLQDAYNIVAGSTTGLKIGTATTQKIGIWNTTPVVQPSAYTQTYATADKTHANATAADLTDQSAGTPATTITALADGTTYANDVASIRNNFASLADQHDKLLVDVLDLKQLVNSVIDDFQAIGWLA